MSEEKAAPDLFDLKFLPAWVKESPNENRYADFAGEEDALPGQRDRRSRDRRAATGASAGRARRAGKRAAGATAASATDGPQRSARQSRGDGRSPPRRHPARRGALCPRGARAGERPGADQSRASCLLGFFARADVSR